VELETVLTNLFLLKISEIDSRIQFLLSLLYHVTRYYDCRSNVHNVMFPCYNLVSFFAVPDYIHDDNYYFQ